MFDRETCKACGACILACPFVEVPRKDAKKAIASLIEGSGGQELVEHCVGCTYCDVLCPTQSNPSDLRLAIRRDQIRRTGVTGFFLMSDDVPGNVMSIGMEFETEEKQRQLDLYAQTTSSAEVFYLGCSLSYIYTDLAKTKLLRDLPMIGGMEFCCGGFVRAQFGDEAAAVHGRQLLRKLKDIGVERMVTFCPECDQMIGEYYPSLIPEFDIESTNIVAYLLEKFETGSIELTRCVDQTVTFHDACAWRKLGPEIHDNPRRLLELLGARVVEMKHHREKSLCCGTPLVGRNRQLAAEIAERRVKEAKQTGAQSIVIGCTGCFALSEQASRQGLEVYHISELAQMAIGEAPPHRIAETRSELAKAILKRVGEDPELLKRRYVIREGKIVPL